MLEIRSSRGELYICCQLNSTIRKKRCILTNFFPESAFKEKIVSTTTLLRGGASLKFNAVSVPSAHLDAPITFCYAGEEGSQ